MKQSYTIVRTSHASYSPSHRHCRVHVAPSHAPTTLPVQEQLRDTEHSASVSHTKNGSCFHMYALTWTEADICNDYIPRSVGNMSTAHNQNSDIVSQPPYAIQSGEKGNFGHRASINGLRTQRDVACRPSYCDLFCLMPNSFFPFTYQGNKQIIRNLVTYVITHPSDK